LPQHSVCRFSSSLNHVVCVLCAEELKALLPPWYRGEWEERRVGAAHLG